MSRLDPEGVFCSSARLVANLIDSTWLFRSRAAGMDSAEGIKGSSEVKQSEQKYK